MSGGWRARTESIRSSLRMGGDMNTVLARLIFVVAILGAEGCASGPSPSTPPTVDVTGNWVGTWTPTNPSLGAGSIQMTLQQTGSQFTGTMFMTGIFGGMVNGFTQGIVFGDRMRVMRPPSFVGDLLVQGNTMSGMIVSTGLPVGTVPTVGIPAGAAAGTGGPYSVVLRRQ